MVAAFPSEQWLWVMYALTHICSATPSQLFKEGV